MSREESHRNGLNCLFFYTLLLQFSPSLPPPSLSSSLSLFFGVRFILPSLEWLLPMFNNCLLRLLNTGKTVKIKSKVK